MEYQFLTEDEQHEALVAYAESQERDHYQHSVNLTRFAAILADPATSPALRAWVQKLHTDTETRLHEVTHYLEKTRALFPAPDRVVAAFVRLHAKRAASVPRQS